MSQRAGETPFEQFAAARAAQLFRSAYLLCGERHGAEDLVQETLAKVYLAWGRGIDNPAAYAQTTLARTFISQRRRRSSTEVPFADLPDSVGADPAEASEVRFAVREVLEGLSPLDRAVLVLRYSEDLSVEDVALRLGLSPGAVRNRSMRALARARERAVRWTTPR